MANGRAGRRPGQGSPAGVGKKIQQTHGLAAPALFHRPANKIPVGRLFRKNASVLETHRPYLKRQVPIADGPAFRQAADFPTAAPFLRAAINSVRPAPQGVLPLRPDSLRVRSDQNLFSPALQPPAAAAVYQLIVLPFVCAPHRRSPFVSVRRGPDFACFPLPAVNLFYHSPPGSSMNCL